MEFTGPLIVIGLYCLMVYVAYTVAKDKNRNPIGWSIAVLFFHVLALFLLWAAPKIDPEREKVRLEENARKNEAYRQQRLRDEVEQEQYRNEVRTRIKQQEYIAQRTKELDFEEKLLNIKKRELEIEALKKKIEKGEA